MKTSSGKHFATINLNPRRTNSAFEIRRPARDLANCSLGELCVKSYFQLLVNKHRLIA